MNQCATLAVAGAYVGGAGGGGEARLDATIVWAVVLSSNGVLLLNLAAFFATISRRHISAFFSFETFADECKRSFYGTRSR